MNIIDEKKEPDYDLLVDTVCKLEDDAQSASQSFEKLAALGSPTAMYYLGEIYRRGLGCSKDINLAEVWFLRAAREGSALSCYALADLYLTTGRAEQSLEFLKMASAQGYAPAMNRLGRIYCSANGVEADFEKARKYFERAVEKGHVIAMGSLGHLLKDHPVKPYDRFRGYGLIICAILLTVYTGVTESFRSEKFR